MRLRVLEARILSFAALAVAALTLMSFLIAKLASLPTTLASILVNTIALALSALVGYEVFFFVQRSKLPRRVLVIQATLDERIPFIVQWVWVYGLLYYLLVGLPVAFLTRRQLLGFIAGGLCILLLSLPIFILLPTACPSGWREYPRNSISARFLSFIQEFDNGKNCIPSLHSAFSAYSATFIPSRITWALFPILVGLSCVLVKQHSVKDIFPSVLLGFAIGFAVNGLFQ